MKLYLDSNNSSNGEYDLDEPIEGKYKLLSFAFTNNIYNVNESNNKIYFTEDYNDATYELEATLTNGIDDASDLKANIVKAMDAVSNGTITVVYDDTTNKFTITNTVPFYFTFGSNTANSASKLLGFNENDDLTYTTTRVSDNPIDLNTYKELFVNINENNDRQIVGVNYFNSSLFIFGDGGLGELVRYNYKDFAEQYMYFKRTKTLTVKIHDLNENVIDLNSDYSLILEKC